MQLLCSAVECLGALINKEIDAAEKDAAQRAENIAAAAAAVNACGGSAGCVGRVTERKMTSSGIGSAPDSASADMRESDEDDAEGMSGREDIVETLAVQLAGVLHKLVQGNVDHVSWDR